MEILFRKSFHLIESFARYNWKLKFLMDFQQPLYFQLGRFKNRGRKKKLFFWTRQYMLIQKTLFELSDQKHDNFVLNNNETLWKSEKNHMALGKWKRHNSFNHIKSVFNWWVSAGEQRRIKTSVLFSYCQFQRVNVDVRSNYGERNKKCSTINFVTI